MRMDQTPDIENEFLVETSGMRLAPTDLTAERNRAAAERIASRADAPDAPRLDLPEGLSIREWIHFGHTS